MQRIRTREPESDDGGRRTTPNGTGGGPGTATELLSFYAYAAGFRTFNMGFTSTVAWATVILMTIVFMLYLRAFRRIEEV